MNELGDGAPDPSRLQNLPVELRAEDFALVARATVATAADTIRAAPDDNLYLSVTLPDGGKVGRLVDCGEGGPRSAGEVEALLAELPSVSAFLHAQEIAIPPVAGALMRDGIRCAPIEAAGGVIAGARLYRGSGTDACDPIPLAEAGAAGLALTRAADAPAATVQIARGSGSPANLVLPRGGTVRIAADREDWFDVAIATDIAGADDIIRLRAAGQLDAVASVLKSLSAADAVTWFDTNPAAGAVLGYGLLRTDPPEMLAAAFADATSRWPEDPDALIIAAEVAARLGRHDEALATFIAAIECGLPAFSFGLNYAADRLRAYGPRPGGPEFSAELTAGAAVALARVHPFASCQESSVLLTCYTGADPTRPESDASTA